MKQSRVILNIFYDLNSVQYLVSTICGLQGVRYGAVLLTTYPKRKSGAFRGWIFSDVTKWDVMTNFLGKTAQSLVTYTGSY
jgi:hypothetical protein